MQVPSNNSTFQHPNHLLARVAGMYLKAYKDNIRAVKGLRVPHSQNYHREIKTRLDVYFFRLARTSVKQGRYFF